MGLSTGLYTWQVEPFWLEFVRMKMPVRNLPESLVGKTIMQISDIHAGDRFDYKYIIDSFQKAQLYNPDFVVYTGDYIHYDGTLEFKKLKEVCQHLVKGRSGTIGILGNHDYGDKWQEPHVAEEITRVLSDVGMTILRNEKVDVGGLHITGIDDLWATNFRPQPVMQRINSDEANLVLVHNPDACDEDIWYDYKGWVLSGHTHGGQCKPPFLQPPILPVQNRKYSAGYINLEDGRHLYINRALGHLMQVRFNVRPEITIFELEKEV